MGELFTATLKYFWLAIDRFMPQLMELEKSTSDKNEKEEILDLIEAYNDIQKQIDKYGLNYDDPNRSYDGEPHEVENWIGEEMLENLGRLSSRLLVSWKEEFEKLKGKKYMTDLNRERMYRLKNLIGPLEALSKEKSYMVGKYADKGPLIFPGEGKKEKIMQDNKIEDGNGIIFSRALLSKIPADVAILCDEFNFSYRNRKPNAGILLLRRILPLAIVRKFQAINKEFKIKDKNNDFLDTKALLGKVEGLLSQKRIYKELDGYKLLIDSSQHSYSLNVDISDAEGAAIKMRIFLDDLF